MIRQLYKRMRGVLESQTGDSVLRGIMDGSLAFSGPETIQIDLTGRCNNNCLCCWHNSPLLGDISPAEKSNKDQELPFKLVKKVLAELGDLGTRNLFLAGGGEPFMHTHIMDILSMAKKCNMRVFLNTNFTLINKETAKELVDIKIDLIHVSLLAGTAKTYALVHPNKTEESFYKIKDVLVCLLNRRSEKRQEAPIPLPHIDLYYVIFNKNYRDIAKMAELAMELKVNSLEFTPIDVIPGKTDVLLLNESQKTEVLREVKIQNERLRDFNARHGGKVTFIEQYASFVSRLSGENSLKGEYETNTVINQPCYVGWAFARILANGEVNPCLKAHRISVGNIHKQSFKSIWNSSAQQLFRKKTLQFYRSDRYFRLIGNNPDSDFGCLNSCDNIQINREMHNKYHGILKEHAKIK